MASSGRKWVLNHGKIWKKKSELSVQSYLSLVTETGSRFAGSKSELISGASSSAVKFCLMIETLFRELKYAIGLTSFHARKPVIRIKVRYNVPKIMPMIYCA